MGTSAYEGPYSALTGLLRGFEQGTEREREIARQKTLDAQASRVTQSDATMRQAEFRNRLGLVADDPTLPSAVTGQAPPSIPVMKTPVTKPGTPLAPSLLNAAVTAFQTAGQAAGPRYQLPNVMGPGRTTYHVDPTQTPEAIKMREASATQAAETQRAVQVEAAKEREKQADLALQISEKDKDRAERLAEAKATAEANRANARLIAGAREKPQLVMGADEQGKPIAYRIDARGGPAVPVEGFTGKSAGAEKAKVLSGITAQTMARQGMTYNDLEQTVSQMEQMENNPAFRAKLSAWNKAKMAGAEAQPNAEAHGLTGMLSNMAGQLASGQVQKGLDPELNTYLNLKQRVGTAFTEVLPRPNQQLLAIEKGLSGIDVGWNPQLMAGVQARRRGGLKVLRAILDKQGLLDDNGTFRLGSEDATPTTPSGKKTVTVNGKTFELP